jgi:uncharacterized protein
MKLVTWLSQFPRTVCIFCIRAYQKTAPIRPNVCRYRPTCSEYALQCILKHGVFTGIALGIRRILRCNPLSDGGHDPVP